MIETKLNNLEINELTEEQYKSAKESGTLNPDSFYMTPSAENISDVLPVIKGGTGATIAADARTNLGFEYGEEVPTHIPETGDGAVYFKIDDEDDGVTPIEHGGTGAITGYDALRNLGAVDYVVEQGVSGIWIYRKWNSGIAECWTNTSLSLTGSTANGALCGGYYAQINNPNIDNFPFTFKEANPNALARGVLGTGLGFCTAYAQTDRIYTISCWGNQNSTSMKGINIEVKGTWK